MPKSVASIPNPISWNWKPLRKPPPIDSKDTNAPKARVYRSNSQRRRNNPMPEISSDCYQTICLGNITQFQNSITSCQSQDWETLENAILDVFQESGHKLLGTGTLTGLHEHVRNLLDSNIGLFIYDRYKSRMLSRGMAILREKVLSNPDLLEGLSENWVQFYSNILPVLDCILFRVKAKCGLTIRQTSLIAFRDEVVFKISFEDKLNQSVNQKKAISADIRQMLLVLQSIAECYPPSKGKVKIESLTALAISPYMAYKGLYMSQKNTEPTVPSREPQLNAKRKSIDLLSRSVSRPLTMQPKQLETLNELFQNAIRKMS